VCCSGNAAQRGTQLYLNNAFDDLARREPQAARTLLGGIVEKTEGVFVWVELVVRNLLTGLRNRDDIVELKNGHQAYIHSGL
jgi:hypothetical protein